MWSGPGNLEHGVVDAGRASGLGQTEVGEGVGVGQELAQRALAGVTDADHHVEREAEVDAGDVDRPRRPSVTGRSHCAVVVAVVSAARVRATVAGVDEGGDLTPT